MGAIELLWSFITSKVAGPLFLVGLIATSSMLVIADIKVSSLKTDVTVAQSNEKIALANLGTCSSALNSQNLAVEAFARESKARADAAKAALAQLAAATARANRLASDILAMKPPTGDLCKDALDLIKAK